MKANKPIGIASNVVAVDFSEKYPYEITVGELLSTGTTPDYDVFDCVTLNGVHKPCFRRTLYLLPADKKRLLHDMLESVTTMLHIFSVFMED